LRLVHLQLQYIVKMWGSRWHSGYNDNYREGRPSVAVAGTAMIIVLVSGSLLYGAAKLVADYGWQGALRYIWEGDPYPSHVRQYLEDLQEMDTTLNHEEIKTLNKLEECLQRAKLDNITDHQAADPVTIVATWEQHVMTINKDNDNINSIPPQNLQKILTNLSYNLDCWATKIDSISLVEGGSEQYYNTAAAAAAITITDLKQQKKNISNRVVQMMERTDVLLQFWKESAAAAAAANPTLADY
jgi:hypothetical protein